LCSLPVLDEQVGGGLPVGHFDPIPSRVTTDAEKANPGRDRGRRVQFPGETRIGIAPVPVLAGQYRPDAGVKYGQSLIERVW
jgi:hypothetical protein